MISKQIQFCGTTVVLSCDGRCDKAWGVNQRPRTYHRDEDEYPDDYTFIGDDLLPTAPDGWGLGTFEGGHGKPSLPASPDKMNKWCARECERSSLDGPLPNMKNPRPNKRNAVV